MYQEDPGGGGLGESCRASHISKLAVEGHVYIFTEPGASCIRLVS